MRIHLCCKNGVQSQLDEFKMLNSIVQLWYENGYVNKQFSFVCSLLSGLYMCIQLNPVQIMLQRSSQSCIRCSTFLKTHLAISQQVVGTCHDTNSTDSRYVLDQVSPSLFSAIIYRVVLTRVNLMLGLSQRNRVKACLRLNGELQKEWNWQTGSWIWSHANSFSIISELLGFA